MSCACAECAFNIARLEEKVRNLTSATSSAAQGTVTALDRLIRAEAVVRAASTFIKDPASVNAIFALDQAVTEYEENLPS